MPNRDDIRWFKDEFGALLGPALASTPLTLDFMAALACQETGEVWPILRRKGLPRDAILKLCVGDTLDADRGRSAFPKRKADLMAAPQGAAMFAVARQALVDMAAHVPAYAAVASRPDKFCHGFGLFQRDLQFFRDDPDWFLNRDYERFDATLGHALGELKKGLQRLGFETRTSLSDLELAAVGIVYNTGGYVPAKGLQQGHFDGTRFYGENLFDYLRLAHTVPSAEEPLAIPVPIAGSAAVALPAAVEGIGTLMRVAVAEGMLRVRREPIVSDPPQRNVVAHLPDGHVVRVVSETARRGFLEIETLLRGARIEGWSSRKFLVAAADDARIEAPPPAATVATAIPAVHMPPKVGLVTRRRGIANARSLNEPAQPGRAGATADELRAELAAIVDWLDVESAQHLRYQPRDGLTFCNIYAHDFCHLAGVYLPRVWWTGPSLVSWARGEAVEPHLGSTIVEVRANALFAWLRDFGVGFGWRQAATLTELQTEVNQGAVGVVSALRKESKRPGHIVTVVPETALHQAKRDAAGNVVAPLQSQAGSTNFRYGRGRKDWWGGEQFADFAFWIHA